MLPCAAYLNGEYGVKDIYVGVPVVIGANGVERIVEIELDAAKRRCSTSRSPSVQGLIEACKKINPACSAVTSRSAARCVPPRFA